MKKDTHSKLDVKWPFHKKLREQLPEIDGQRFPKISEASALVAVNQRYNYNFSQIIGNPFTSMDLDKLQALMNKPYRNLGLLINYSATWPHFFVILALDLKKVENSQLKSFEEVAYAAKTTTDYTEQWQWSANQEKIKQMFSAKSQKNLIEAESKDPAPTLILSATLKKHEEHKQLLNKMTALYDGKITTEEVNQETQLQFKKAVNFCVKRLINRLFKKELIPLCNQEKLFCSIRDTDTGVAYEINKLLHRLMVQHVLEETSYFLFLTEKYGLHYILQEGSKKKNVAKDKLLRCSMQIFKEKIAHLGQLQSMRFTPIKTLKLEIDEKLSSPPLIEEEKLSSSNLPIHDEVNTELARDSLLDLAEISPVARTAIGIVARLFKSEKGISTVECILNKSPLDDTKNDKFAYNFLTESVVQSRETDTLLQVIRSMVNTLVLEACISITDQVVKNLSLATTNNEVNTESIAKGALLDITRRSPVARVAVGMVARLFKTDKGISTMERILSNEPLNETKKYQFAYRFLTTTIKQSLEVYTALLIISSMLIALPLESCIFIINQIVKDLKINLSIGRKSVVSLSNSGFALTPLPKNKRKLQTTTDAKTHISTPTAKT